MRTIYGMRMRSGDARASASSLLGFSAAEHRAMAGIIS
jgi:hypothetical protein